MNETEAKAAWAKSLAAAQQNDPRYISEQFDLRMRGIFKTIFGRIELIEALTEPLEYFSFRVEDYNIDASAQAITFKLAAKRTDVRWYYIALKLEDTLLSVVFDARGDLKDAVPETFQAGQLESAADRIQSALDYYARTAKP